MKDEGIKVYENEFPTVGEVVFEAPLDSDAILLAEAAEFMKRRGWGSVVFLSMERKDDCQVLRLGLE